MVSLSSQLTRCYSQNRTARFKCHLAVSSFGGRLKDRFDTTLAKSYKSWKDFEMSEEDFLQVAEKAQDSMPADKVDAVAGALANQINGEELKGSPASQGEVIYLSSESEHTLSELKPFSTYIIGGLVDRNRHKGICYKHAMDKGVKTAKLPIGEYFQMSSRHVLATNHVLEIMLKWLEFGDWGKAFMEIIPKRKGGELLPKGPKEAQVQGQDQCQITESREDSEMEDELEEASQEGENDDT